MKIKKSLLILLVIVLIVSSLCFLMKYFGLTKTIPWYVGYNDIAAWAKESHDPGFFYINKNLEYPVITGVVMELMSIPKSTAEIFLIKNAIFLILIALLSSYVLYKIAVENKISKKRLIIYWALAPSMFLFIIYNWDIIAVLFFLLALYFFQKNKDYLCSIFLALGFSSKYFTILFLLPMLLKGNIKRGVKMVSIFIATFFIINIFFILKSFNVWFYIYSYHSTRLPNVDSIWRIIMALFPFLKIDHVNIISLILFAITYLIVIFWKRKEDIYYLCFISLLLFLFFNKIFSPQYTLWLLPFFVLISFLNKKEFYSMELSNAAVLFISLSWIFMEPKKAIFFNLSTNLVIIRHIVILYLIYFTLKKTK